MKAVLMDSFGGVDVLKVGEAEKPSPAEGQVLVKVLQSNTSCKALSLKYVTLMN